MGRLANSRPSRVCSRNSELCCSPRQRPIRVSTVGQAGRGTNCLPCPEPSAAPREHSVRPTQLCALLQAPRLALQWSLWKVPPLPRSECWASQLPALGAFWR